MRRERGFDILSLGWLGNQPKWPDLRLLSHATETGKGGVREAERM